MPALCSVLKLKLSEPPETSSQAAGGLKSLSGRSVFGNFGLLKGSSFY